MASLTIRDLDERLKARLRVRAAHHNRSMEEEVRAILRATLAEEAGTGRSLVRALRARFESLGGLELELPPRESIRQPTVG